MYYCFVSSHDDSGDGCHRLFFGSLADIAASLIDHCHPIIPWDEVEDGTLDDLETEYACDLDSYHNLADSDDPTEDAIRSFDFCFSGARVFVIALTATFADLAAAFNVYAPETYLGDVRMIPADITDPAELKKIDSALIGHDLHSSPYFERIEEE
ncbi:MAG: hypothetical protein IJD94_05220 [Clostridia bacterium]|nr:hypothetical protein [Clostridia bacterium]